MTVETVTVGELLNQLAFRVEGSNTPDAIMRPNYLWALQAVQRELVLDLDLMSFRRQYPLLLKPNIQDYPLADDFRRLIVPSMVYVDEDKSTMMHIHYQEYDAEEGDRNFTSKARPRRFTLLWVEEGTALSASEGRWMCRFFPTPDVEYPVRYRCFTFPRRMDDDTDGTTVLDRRLPAQFKDALVNGAVMKFYSRITQLELQAASRDFEIVKRQIRRNNRPYSGDVFWKDSPRRGAGHRRRWTGSGTFGAPWMGGAAGPQP